MLNAIIVDDEFPAREELKSLISELPNFRVIAAFEDGSEVIEYLKTPNQADVVFLDVQMRCKDGITTAWEILQLPSAPYIVFVTGFGEYAVKAFELNAVDYIMKPYDERRLAQTAKKLQELQFSERLSNANVCDFFNNALTSKNTRFCVYQNGKMIILQPKDIIFVKSEEMGKTIIVSERGNFPTRLPLKDFEAKLASTQLLRIHKSYLVNPDKVREIIPWFNNTLMLVLEGYETERIPVARHYIKDFQKAFQKI
ncbi:MAG: LytTR family DNA-binding domain-containing protein [Sporomusaceae bacterium]|nr:LytTR family DNA-binding domain-containing protein [Sporomusaceae bacterium]